MKILVTGTAGFIGFYTTKRLLEHGNFVVGIDNINHYYSTKLKHWRLSQLGVKQEKIEYGKPIKSSIFPNFIFIKLDIEDEDGLKNIFNTYKFRQICNLAAQAGVRYSIENPKTYIKSNVVGFFNILECCRHGNIEHLIYASSSSVYGLNSKTPFSEKDSISHPLSLYAATKAGNELMAHAYSHLYKIPTTGLRFFTVYGPAGRPDMSPFIFAKAIIKNETIKIFNKGDMLRDFTYIDDIVEGVVRIMGKIPKTNLNFDTQNPDPSKSTAPYQIFNIGNSQPIELMDFIKAIETACGKTAKKEFMPMQAGDVYQTNADTGALESTINFKPNTNIQCGINKTIEWFKTYYNEIE